MAFRNWIVAGVVGGMMLCATGVWAAPGKAPGKAPAKADATAGEAPAAKRPAGKGERVHTQGTVDSIEKDEVKITTKDGEKCTAVVSKKGHLRVTGTAEPTCFKSGVHLQFNALVDKKSHRIKDPVGKILIYTPSNSLYPGLIPDPSPAAVAAAAEVVDLSVDWKPYIVSGTFGSLEGQKLVLSVPSFAPRLSVELADKLKIEFDIDDLSVAQPGDTLRVTKGQQSGDRISVMDGTIKRKAPLTSLPKSTAPKSTAPKKGGPTTPGPRSGAKAKK